MLSLTNLGDVFFWTSGLVNFCFFVFVAKWFIGLFKRSDK